MDYADIARVVSPLVSRLDHSNLNDVEGLDNPTAEHLAFWFWERLREALPGLCEVEVRETESSSCRYRGEGAP